MITESSAYFLGLLLSKGEILKIDDDFIKFKINVKFRKPDDQSLRSDNIHSTITTTGTGKENLASKFFNDFFYLQITLKKEFGIDFQIGLDVHNPADWNKKVVSLESEKISNKDSRFLYFFNVEKIVPEDVNRFPFHLNLEKNKKLSLAFVQGVCDACSLIPNEASSQNGGTGIPRIQLEPDQSRWELCIGLCKTFQEGLNIRVNNINWGHPEIRTSWKGQNHQFRVSLNNIPPYIELYRFEYKKEEYYNLYHRQGVVYDPQEEMCPLKKKGIKKADHYLLFTSDDADLNSELLDQRLQGISIDVPGKKSIMACYLLGCEACKKYINVEIQKPFSDE